MGQKTVVDLSKAAPIYEGEDFVVDAAGTLRYTKAGRERYRARFGKAGLDIRAIHTIEQHGEALRASFNFLLADLHSETARKPRTTGREALLALLRGERDLGKRLLDRVKRRSRSGLRVAGTPEE